MHRLLVFFIFVTVHTFASVAVVSQKFADFYSSPQIDFRLCGLNQKLFVDELARSNIDISQYIVIGMVNKGNDYSGFVKAFNVRWGKLIRSLQYPSYVARLDGWHHHVFGYYKGYVFDFHQGIQPTVMKISDYVSDMYLPKYPIPTFGSYQVYDRRKALEAIHNFQLTMIDGRTFLEKPISYNSNSKIFLIDFL